MNESWISGGQPPEAKPGSATGGHLERLAAPGDPLLDLLLETSPCGLLVIDTRGRIARRNAIAGRLLGAQAVPGGPVLAHFAPAARSDAEAALHLALSGQSPARFVAPLANAAAPRHVAADVVPIPKTGASPAGCLLYLTDITDGRALEAELAHGQKLQAVGQLAGGIAHDFNNLLTTIIAASELILQRDGQDVETLADTRHIQASAVRGAALVKQLLGFSRQQPPVAQALAIDPAIQGLTEMLRRLLGSRVRLDLRLAAPAITAHVDPTQFDQVLINLVVNARAAMGSDGTLILRTAAYVLAVPTVIGSQTIPPGNYVQIDVEDSGGGISAAVLPHIFEPFFTTRQGAGGTGLGLSTVQAIIRASGGFLTVESPPGLGACFCILLPVLDPAPRPAPPPESHLDAAPAQPPAAQPVAGRVPIGLVAAGVPPPDPAANDAPGALPAGDAASRPGGSALAAPIILLVDDEEGILAVAARALRQRGWRVIACDSPEAALAYSGSERPAAVVSDVVMPGMDGPALVRALQARWSGLPAILVSGYAEGALRLNLAKSQVRFLPKPYTLRELAEALDSLVEPAGLPISSGIEPDHPPAGRSVL